MSSGVLRTLLHSPSPATQAAAASTMTKLAIKAKAMTADSAEVGQIMNTVLSVLKTATSAQRSNASASSPSTDVKGRPTDGCNAPQDHSLVSFSALDTVSMDQQLKEKKNESSPLNSKRNEAQRASKESSSLSSSSSSSDAVVMTSVERAIEVLAAMVGRTHVKEEIVHGSYR